jgi:type IV secretion system protein TrbJ
MVHMNKRLSILCVAIATTFSTLAPLNAHATGLIAGATEPTQIANNVLLAGSLAEEAATAAATLATKITVAQQYLTMLQNIKNLPANMLAELSKPYKDQIKAFTDLQKSIKDVKNAAEETRAMFTSRGMDFRQSGKSFSDYLKFEVALAEKKGGVYKKRMDQDLAAMDTMKEKAIALRSVADKTASITGSVQGLQQLSNLASMQAGELMEIKSAILDQNVARNSDKLDAEEAAKNKAILMGAVAKGAKERSTRDNTTTFRIGDPYERNWNGLETQR